MTTPVDPPERSAAPDLHDLVALARGVAEQAGALLVGGLGQARTRVDTKTTSTDMVTEMDQASERLIVEGILAARPDDGILAEEGSTREGSSGLRWVIDPLDGTTNYLYGHPGFGISIAAEHAGETVAAVVFDPVHDELFTATRGGGAFRNGRPIRPSGETVLARALLATGFSYDAERRIRQATVLAEVLGQVRDIRRMGAAAVDLCSVACGRVDAFYERGLGPWDHAGGVLVALESGALVGDLAGGRASGAFCLAASPALFVELRELLTAAGAAEA